MLVSGININFICHFINTLYQLKNYWRDSSNVSNIGKSQLFPHFEPPGKKYPHFISPISTSKYVIYNHCLKYHSNVNVKKILVQTPIYMLFILCRMLNNKRKQPFIIFWLYARICHYAWFNHILYYMIE